MGGKPKKSTRRCAFCDKTGHNKSTCPKFFLTSKAKKPTAFNPPLKFFIHHVTNGNAPSPHEVNLRANQYNAWQKINSEAPSEKTSEKLFNTSFKQIEPVKASRQLSEEKKNIIASFLITSKKIKEPSKLKLVLKQKISFAKRIIEQILYSRYTIVALIVLLLIIIASGPAQNYYYHLINAKQAVYAQGLSGLEALKNAFLNIAAGNLNNALQQNTQAVKSFSLALQTISQQNVVLKTLASGLPVTGDKITGGQKLLLAGGQIAVGNNLILSQAVNNLSATATWPEKFNALTPAIAQALPYYREAINNLSAVNAKILPPNLRPAFAKYKQLTEMAAANLNRLNDLIKVSPEILGQNGRRRYLLVFQNPSELRPTGGFMGSLAIAEVKNGKILSLEVPPGGTYDLKGQLDTNVVPPTPLLLLNKRWEMQDANWFPNFPDSAKKILWFYRHSRGVTADGVIAINASVLERIIVLLGPITYSNRNLTLTASSALPTLQAIIEEGPEKKTNKPKQVLADLAPVIINALSSSTLEQIPALITSLDEALAQKEIQLYFTDLASEQAMRNFGWDGALTQTAADQDYLLVVNANIRGQKSDSKLEQKIFHQAIVQADGSIIATVAIIREHNGKPGEKLYGQTNVNYLRLYVPLGSELIKAKGFSWPDEKIFRVPEPWFLPDPHAAKLETEVSTDQASGTRVTNEFNKTVFGNWVITEPSATSTVEFTYRLPFAVNLSQPAVSYRLVVDRQSGDNSTLENQIIFPAGWRPIWKNNSAWQLANNGAYLNSTHLLRNNYFYLILKKSN